MNNAVSRLIVEQILREAEPRAATGRETFRKGLGLSYLEVLPRTLSSPCLALPKFGHLWGGA